MRFAMYTRGALDFPMALAISGINRLGRMLVYSDPGPRRIRFALRMASTALGMGRTRRGDSVSLSIRDRLALMRVSPCTRLPFSSLATRWTLERVEGKIRP